MVKRTKKTFTDYNQYKDRPFGLKWATAYAMEGQFLGEAYEDYFVLNEQAINWTDVRHVSIKKEEKWFNVDYFQDRESSRNKQKKKASKIEKEIELIKNEYYQDFADDD